MEKIARPFGASTTATKDEVRPEGREVDCFDRMATLCDERYAGVPVPQDGTNLAIDGSANEKNAEI